MSIRITTLSENTANIGFIAEWGQSILIEADGKKILFDTGYSYSAIYNALALGINLKDIDCIILSHGHVDHTGGLRNILKLTGKTDLIAHPDIWTEKYIKRDKDKDELTYIGIPFKKLELQSLGATFIYSDNPYFITGNIFTSGVIPMITDFERVEDNLLIKDNQSLKPDTMTDDLAIGIKTNNGLVIILGCAHRGMINTALQMQNIANEKRIYAIIGGTHLIRTSQEYIQRTVAFLKDLDPQKIGVSHCTGFHASAIFAQEFKEKFFLNNACTQIEFPD